MQIETFRIWNANVHEAENEDENEANLARNDVRYKLW